MLASAEVHELGETLSDVEASVGDLIPPSPSSAMAEKREKITYEIGRSRVNKMMVDHLETEGCFDQSRAKLPGRETVPSPPGKEYAVVFRDFITCGLRFIPCSFLPDVLDAFNVQIHQLTPNGIAALSKFV